MIIPSSRSLLTTPLQCKSIPMVESRIQFLQALDAPHTSSILLRHCNIFELTSLLHDAQRREVSIYVNIDHIDGIHADFAGLSYLAEHMHITGIVSNHPRTLALGKRCHL